MAAGRQGRVAGERRRGGLMVVAEQPARRRGGRLAISSAAMGRRGGGMAGQHKAARRHSGAAARQLRDGGTAGRGEQGTRRGRNLVSSHVLP